MYVLTLFRFALVRRNTLVRSVRLGVLCVGILFGFRWPCSMYMLVFCGGLSALVQIERPSSIYVGILFRLSMLVRLVQSCFMYMLAM